jgi:hypothetical protein
MIQTLEENSGIVVDFFYILMFQIVSLFLLFLTGLRLAIKYFLTMTKIYVSYVYKTNC